MLNRSIALLCLALVTIVPLLGVAAPAERAIMVVGDLDNVEATALEAQLRDSLKKMRESGELAEVPGLSHSFLRYDFQRGDHASQLARWGVTRARGLRLLVVGLDGRGLPTGVRWGVAVKDLETGLSALRHHLEIRTTVDPARPSQGFPQARPELDARELRLSLGPSATRNYRVRQLRSESIRRTGATNLKYTLESRGDYQWSPRGMDEQTGIGELDLFLRGFFMDVRTAQDSVLVRMDTEEFRVEVTGKAPVVLPASDPRHAKVLGQLFSDPIQRINMTAWGNIRDIRSRPLASGQDTRKVEPPNILQLMILRPPPRALQVGEEWTEVRPVPTGVNFNVDLPVRHVVRVVGFSGDEAECSFQGTFSSTEAMTVQQENGESVVLSNFAISSLGSVRFDTRAGAYDGMHLALTGGYRLATRARIADITFESQTEVVTVGR